MLRHFLPVLIITISAISCKKDKGQESPSQSKETSAFVTYRCAQDMHTIQEGAQCCFRGQTFRGSSCQGTPVCPVGMRAEHDTCIWEMKDVKHEPPPTLVNGEQIGLMRVERTRDEHDHTRLSVTVPYSSAFPDVISKLNLASAPHGTRFDALRTRLELDKDLALHRAYDAHYDFIWETDWIRDVNTLHLANCTQIHPSRLTTFLRSSDVSKLVLEHNVHIECADTLFSFWSQQDDLGQLTSLKLEADIAYQQTMRDLNDANPEVMMLRGSDGFREYVSSPLFHQLKSLEISGHATHEDLARALKGSPLAPSLTSFLLTSAHVPEAECSQYHDGALIDALLTRNASRDLEHIRLVYPRTHDDRCNLQDAFKLLPDAHIERIRNLTISHPSLGDESVKGVFSRRDLHHIETLSFFSSSLTASIFHALPESSVISQVQELNLSHNALRGRDFPDPEHTDQVDFSLQRFDLSHNTIDARAMTWFLRRGMLSRVQDLNLSGNQLRDSKDWQEPENGEHPYMYALRKLSLRGTAISVDGLRWFARHGLDEVEELDLSYNKLDDEALKVLIEEVDWKRLRILKLGHNMLTDVSLGALATSKLLLKLQQLDLSYNLFVGEDVSTGSRPLSYPLLRRLDLSHNPWTSKGYKMMFTLPWLNHVNHVLMISSSDETPAHDWSQILNVAARTSLHPTILTIDDEHLSDVALSHLSRAPWLRHIKELHLRGSFSGHTLSELADSLDLGSLVYLELKSSRLLPEHAGKLAYHASMKQLKHVDIDYDPLSHDENDSVLIAWLSSPQTHSLKSLSVTTLCSKVYEDHGAYTYAHLSPHMQEEHVASALSQRTRQAALIHWLDWKAYCPDMALMKTLASSEAIDPFLREYYRVRMNLEVMRQKSYRDDHPDSH